MECEHDHGKHIIGELWSCHRGCYQLYLKKKIGNADEQIDTSLVLRPDHAADYIRKKIAEIMALVE